MKRRPEDLERQTFDLLVVGGGITGACVACDAATRGLSVALVEKGDFGGATSSASSKLLHGGIRYLQQGQMGKVRESASERIHFRNLAPHLVRPLPFVVPSQGGWRRGKALLGAGMTAYQLLCRGAARHQRQHCTLLGEWQLLSQAQVRSVLPAWGDERITGGVLFHELHMHSSERMTLAFIDTMARFGGVPANYLRAEGFLAGGGRVHGIRAWDLLGNRTLEVRARMVVNAAGPWIPLLNLELDRRAAAGIVTAYSKGVHLVVPPLTDGRAVALASRRRHQGVLHRGGRHHFIIPWREHSLVGTTYGPYQGDLDELRPLEEDVQELIEDINLAAGEPLIDRPRVRHAFAGIYPLVDDEVNPQIYQGTGRYQVIDHRQRDGLAGLVSAFGAKFVTARLVAEKAVDLVIGQLGRSGAPCRLRGMALVAGDIDNLDTFRTGKIREYQHLLTAPVVEHLIAHHGQGVDAVAGLVRRDAALAAPLAEHLPVIGAEVVHAAREEMACHLADVVFRRTGLGTLGHPGEVALQGAAELLGEALGWSSAQCEKELAATGSCFLS
jgi:glycerol-3-phosphate dehydrogenase